jgi:two-component system, cell cycle response regulator CpdR
MTEAFRANILLAEDDAAMRTYLERALGNAGFSVDSVDRGTAALPLLEENHYDLLLSDIVMPEMDGIELAQKCNELSPDTKVMFITGFAAVTLKASREQPQAKVLSKPFHLKDLVLEVERVLGDRLSASL